MHPFLIFCTIPNGACLHVPKSAVEPAVRPQQKPSPLAARYRDRAQIHHLFATFPRLCSPHPTRQSGFFSMGLKKIRGANQSLRSLAQ
ncbi:hypothetical protein B0H17DRAFT_1065066, partial [Mycena rosella]